MYIIIYHHSYHAYVMNDTYANIEDARVVVNRMNQRGIVCFIHKVGELVE